MGWQTRVVKGQGELGTLQVQLVVPLDRWLDIPAPLPNGHLATILIGKPVDGPATVKPETAAGHLRHNLAIPGAAPGLSEQMGLAAVAEPDRTDERVAGRDFC